MLLHKSIKSRNEKLFIDQIFKDKKIYMKTKEAFNGSVNIYLITISLLFANQIIYVEIYNWFSLKLGITPPLHLFSPTILTALLIYISNTKKELHNKCNPICNNIKVQTYFPLNKIKIAKKIEIKIYLWALLKKKPNLYLD